MSRDTQSFKLKRNYELLGKINHSTIIQFFSIAVSLILSAFMIRVIGAENAGVITTLNAMVAICLIFTTFGWPVILTKVFAGNSGSSAAKIFKRALKESGVLTALVCLALLILSETGLLPELEYGFAFVLILLFLRTLMLLTKAVLDGMGQVAAGQYCVGLVMPLITMACFIPLNPMSDIKNVLMLYSLSVALGFAALVFLFVFKYQPDRDDESSSDVEIKREGNWWLMSTRLSNVILLKADIIIMSYYIEDRSIAIYGLICQVVTILTISISAGNAIFGPAIVKQYNAGDLDSARNTFRSVQKYVLAWSCPLFMLLCLFPGFILSILTGESVDGPFSFCLVVLAISQMANAATGPVATALYMKGEVVFFSLSMIISVFLNVIGNLVLVPRYGIAGAAAATATVAILVNLVQYMKARSLKIA
ncbi:lipopolysaccharide biosynthesis protein [Pseudomonas sp. HMWF034]|uniref:lipopolysaccharide biosynthesis protein n=2 Tax=unclassified Pseudomonas TaxID=196821 RepID=UPI0013048826|nr:polysaccharide biosynthesis C-terminal domain-containing protein [Pseudomonas sp. HMWF034]